MPAFPKALPAFPEALLAFPEALPAFPEALPAFPKALPAFPEALPAFPEALLAFPEALPAFLKALPAFPEALLAFPEALPAFLFGGAPRSLRGPRWSCSGHCPLCSHQFAADIRLREYPAPDIRRWRYSRSGAPAPYYPAPWRIFQPSDNL